MYVFEDQILWQFQKAFFFKNLGMASKPPWKPYLLNDPSERNSDPQSPLKLKNYFLTFFSRMLVSKDIGVRGLGPNPKIFKKYFLELSYNLLLKNLSHLCYIFYFVLPTWVTVMYLGFIYCQVLCPFLSLNFDLWKKNADWHLSRFSPTHQPPANFFGVKWKVWPK